MLDLLFNSIHLSYADSFVGADFNLLEPDLSNSLLVFEYPAAVKLRATPSGYCSAMSRVDIKHGAWTIFCASLSSATYSESMM